MSELRELLRRPGLYLACVALAICAVGLDASRAPRRQRSAQAYGAVVAVYQRSVRPLLEGRVQCRYRPTCSVYSTGAVSEHGIVEGLALTIARLRRCRRDVPIGTADPVPAAHEER